jgi:hypothetical protein
MRRRTLDKPMPPKRNIEWCPVCPLWWKSSCALQGLYGLRGPTEENIPTSPFENIHSSRTNQTNPIHSAKSNLCSSNQSKSSKSKLSVSNKHLTYKIILEPIWTYGMQLWNAASTSEILEHFQSRALPMIVDAPWYVPNTVVRRDLQIPTIQEEIRHYSSQYSARLSAHSYDLTVNFIELPDNRRLRRHLPNDLPTRFLV